MLLPATEMSLRSLSLTQCFSSLGGVLLAAVGSSIPDGLAVWIMFGAMASTSMAATELLRDREKGIKTRVADVFWLVVLKGMLGIGAAVGSALLISAFRPDSSPSMSYAAAFFGGLLGKEIPVYARLFLRSWVDKGVNGGGRTNFDEKV